MKDNDLSAAPTHRYWVLSDVVFAKVESSEVRKAGWFRKTETIHTAHMPDLRAMSELWRWSSRYGVRLELIFVGEDDAPALWESLVKAANPFSDFIEFENINDVVGLMDYRPDLLGVIDVPERSAYYGGRGLTMQELR